MSTAHVLATTVHLRCRHRGKRRLEAGTALKAGALPPGRVPRVARLMTLAIKLDDLVRRGEVRDYAALARLGYVSRPRITQIMNLLLLAPDIQEALLFLPRTRHGRDPILLCDLQPISMAFDWREQRARWRLAARSAVSRVRRDERPAPT